MSDSESLKSPAPSKKNEKPKSTKKTVDLERNGEEANTATKTSEARKSSMQIVVSNSDDENTMAERSRNSTRRSEKQKSPMANGDDDQESDDSNKTSSTIRIDQEQDLSTSTKNGSTKERDSRSPKRKNTENGIDDVKIKRSKNVGNGIVNAKTSGFERGWKAEKILGATDVNGQIEFVVKFKNQSPVEMVAAKIVNIECPQVVIEFYESRITWNHSDAEDDHDTTMLSSVHDSD